MDNYKIKLDLLKIRGAKVQRLLKGKEGEPCQCLVIPLQDNPDLFVGEKGVYINLVGIAMREPLFEDTHCIKVNYPREVWGRMTHDQAKATPVLGGMRLFPENTPNKNNQN